METDVTGCDLSDARIEGRVRIHPTAVVERTTVRGPAVIGPHAVLQDSFVGPYSAVGKGVRLEGAELEHSIVLDNAVIRHIGQRLEDSLVGTGATVTPRLRLPLRPAAPGGPQVRGTARLALPRDLLAVAVGDIGVVHHDPVLFRRRS